MAAVYFGSFGVWFIIGFILGGCQWRALLIPVQWMITGHMILYFPSGLPGLFAGASKDSFVFLAAIGYAIYALLAVVGMRLKETTTFRVLTVVFAFTVLLNHVGCMRVWKGATSGMTLP